MVSRNIADMDLTAAAVCRQDVISKNSWRLLESRIEVAPADLLPPQVIVDLTHVLVVVLMRRRTLASPL